MQGLVARSFLEASKEERIVILNNIRRELCLVTAKELSACVVVRYQSLWMATGRGSKEESLRKI